MDPDMTLFLQKQGKLDQETDMDTGKTPCKDEGRDRVMHL